MLSFIYYYHNITPSSTQIILNTLSDCKITPTDLTVANSNLAYTASLLAGEGHSVQISYNNSYDKKLEGLTARPLSPKITDPNIVIGKKNRKLSNLGNLFLEKLRDSLNN